MQWIDDNTLEMGGVIFDLDITSGMNNKESSGNCFLLAKHRTMIQKYCDLAEKEKVENICELGIYKGGSCLLFHELFGAKKTVAIDYCKPYVPLETYIAKNNLSQNIKTYYEIDQANRSKVTSIIEEEFKGEAIDMVFDDASHFLDETKSSFNTIFPYLRHGGYYIIEDWAWAHWPGDQWQKDGGIWADRSAMTNLIFEIVMACPTNSGLIESIEITCDTVYIKRGRGLMPEGEFDISEAYNNRGKPFLSPI